MCKKMIYLTLFVLVLSLVGNVQAADVFWTDAGPAHLWSTPANWDTGAVPTSSDTIWIGVLPGPTIANQGAVASKLFVGQTNAPGDLTVNGGTVTITSPLQMGRDADSDGTLYMISGTINADNDLYVGNSGLGTINMGGGTIAIANHFRIGNNAIGAGYVNLNGGIVTAGNLTLANRTGSVGEIDFRGGILIIDGDNVEKVQGYIDNGWITAYGGKGTLQLDYNVTNFGRTTLKGLMPGPAYEPNPADEQTDVPRDVVLSWELGDFAAPTNGHKIYLGESFDDVNDATGSVAQSAASYTPAQRLDFSTTYYWRVDEVNAPPTSQIEFKGEVWQFTTEPIAYAIENITATASGSEANKGPENTINGSGLDADDLHSMEATDMWLSGGELNAWIEYELDKVYKLHEMWVWNSNDSLEPVIGFGFKDVTIEYSTNGTDYTTLGTTHEFARAPGMPDYAYDTTVDFNGVTAKYVRLTANSGWGDVLDQYGLSEVRFFSIPVFAREPSPDSDTTDVAVDVTLGFRAGRDAVEHNVYISTDEQAVIDETISPVSVPADSSYATYDTGALDLDQTYYWKVNEVNEAEPTTTWQGDIWNLSTQESLVVDDFESYNEIPDGEEGSNLVYLTWIDGFDNPLVNGSTMGHTVAFEPSMEGMTVYDGVQSAPLYYDNSTAGYSEATVNVANLQVGQDWTKHNIKALTLRFFGDPNNAVEQMYVKVNGSKFTYDGDAENLKRIGWQMWYIDLASLGVSLSNVTELSIGFERIGAFGGQGVVYFDGIRLYSHDRQLVTPVDPGTTGLQAHYEFEGTYSDSSVNGRHGTAVGAPVFVAGKLGQAISLDGIDDYVNIDGYKGILADANGVQHEFTLAAWIKTTANGEIITWGSSPGGQRMTFRVDTVIRVEHGNGNIRGTSGPDLRDNQWHHVAAMLPRGARIMDVLLYVDGFDVTPNSADEDPFVLTGDADVSIGRRATSDDRYFTGSIDDARIYDRVLTPEEAAWLGGRTEPFDKPF